MNGDGFRSVRARRILTAGPRGDEPWSDIGGIRMGRKLTRRQWLARGCAAASSLAVAGAHAQPPAPRVTAREPFDILITGGRVVDGSGNPWFRADVGLRGDRVAAVGRLGQAAAKVRIDAAGQVVAPGF